MDKLITNYRDETDQTMIDIWNDSKNPWTALTPGVPGNPNLLLTVPEETAYTDAGDLMLSTHEDAPTGTETQKEAARNAMAAYKIECGVVAIIGNQKCGAVASKLKSTGLEMALPHAAVGQMDKPTISDAIPVDGVTGREIIVFYKSKKFCHGTWVRLTHILTGTVTLSHVNQKERFPLSGLIPQNQYSVEVAFDGTDPLVVWSDPKLFWAQ